MADKVRFVTLDSADARGTQSAEVPVRLTRPIGFLLLLLLTVSVLSLGLFPIRDGGDQWWHLKTGQYLVQVRFDFPEEDVFSWTSAGHSWANHEWLADTLMFLTYRAVGLKGLIAVKAVILAVAFLLVGGLIYRRTNDVLWSLSGALLAGWAAQFSMHLRPPVLTCLLTAVYLHLVLNLRDGKKVALTQGVSFPLMVLWINLHGGAILGLVIAGLCLAGALLSWLAGRLASNGPATQAESLGQARRFGLNLAILGLASFCNPFTYHIHLLTLKVMGNKELLQYVSELQMPNLHHTTGYLVLLILLVAFGLGSVRRFRLSEALLVLFFLHQSLLHVRHLPLFAIVVTPILFEQIAAWQHSLVAHPSGAVRRIGQAGWGILLALFVLGAGILLTSKWQRNVRPLLRSPGYLRYGPPVDAVNFLQRHPFRGRMYNPINFSGYLIWRLSPERFKTFTDSRFDIFGSDILIDCLAIESGNTLAPVEYTQLSPVAQDLLRWQIEKGLRPPYWKKALEDYGIDFMILGRDSRLHLLLSGAEQSGWAKVYEDAGYAIYVRDAPENRDLIESARRTYDAQQESRMRASPAGFVPAPPLR